MTDDRKPLAAELARHIVRIFDCAAVAVYDRELEQVFRAGSEEGNVSDQRLKDSALQSTVFHDNVPGATTLPVTLGGQSAGSISVPDTAFSDPALHAIVNLCAIALEREKAQAGVNRAEAWRKSEELKATLLDALAHEFKTPLTAIKASATALLGRAGEGLGHERELLSVIDEEAGRLDDMVTESIQLARIEAGKLQLQRRPERVADLLESAVKGCANLSGGAGGGVRERDGATRCGGGPGVDSAGAAAAFVKRREVLRAGHADSRGGLGARGRGGAGSNESGAGDRGAGAIDDLREVLSLSGRVARGFRERAWAWRSRERLCRRTRGRSGWKALLERARSSTFPSGGGAAMTSGHILVVDDEPQIRRVMKTTLVANGYQVSDARSGERRSSTA